MRITKFIRSKKGISPIFAALILIAIAVIAGIVVYMFTSGTIGSLTSGGTAAQEKAAVQGVGNFDLLPASADTMDVYASYVSGGTPITINGAIIKAADGSTMEGTAASVLTTDGALISVAVTANGDLASGQSYSVTLTSSKGGSFASSSFQVP